MHSMKSWSPTLATYLAAAAILACGHARGHGDADLPLYVAEGGIDAGDCLDAANPCGSIAYALGRATKGGQVQVASGTYRVENAEDIFHLVSGVVSVTGGHERGGARTGARAGVSVLAGVPFRYRELLADQGFEVIADSKGADEQQSAEADKLLAVHQSLKSSIPATPCNGGMAAGLPCSNVDLLSHVGFNDMSRNVSAGNDVWGFVDLNTGREYAIAGFNIGTAVFDVTDPTNPREVGFVDGQPATWRDIKVYQFHDDAAGRWRAYAYVTTDGSTDGLFVIDLSGLPHSIRWVAAYPSDIFRAHNVYATNTDYSTGISLTGELPTLIIAGSDMGSGSSSGRYRAYALDDPEAPAWIPGGTGAGYMHDASSIIVTDARKDTQCVNGGTYCEILLDFNEETLEIFDITDAASPQRLYSSRIYSNTDYVHSGWWSEDKQTVFVHDETDERNQGLPTTLRAFDISDFRNPVPAGTWQGPTNAIDHNGFVRGNRYYMSNYTRGLTVLDISDPSNMTAVGRLDTYPASDGTIFNGAWGAYPFLPSGNVAVSDIDSGFYMAADQTRDVPQGMLQFSAPSFSVEEGQQAQLTVQRAGNSGGAVSVDFEILHATADSADYTVGSGTMNWGDGDTTNRSILLTAMNDGVAEAMERLIIRLINPAGGATLGNMNSASLYLSDPGAAPEVSFAAATVEVAERGFGTVVAVVRRTGNAIGAVSVDYSMTAGNATAGDDFTGSTSGTLNWASGDGNPRMIELLLADDGIVEGAETIEMSLGNPGGATIGAQSTFTATIRDGDGANAAPNAIAGSNQTRSSGSQVTLHGGSSNDPDGDLLTYSWTQTSGTVVALDNANTAAATFTAPTVTSDTLLRFQLTVTDPGGLSDAASTSVTVTKPGGGAQQQQSSSGGSVGMLTLLVLLTIAVRRRLIRTDH